MTVHRSILPNRCVPNRWQWTAVACFCLTACAGTELPKAGLPDPTAAAGPASAPTGQPPLADSAPVGDANAAQTTTAQAIPTGQPQPTESSPKPSAMASPQPSPAPPSGLPDQETIVGFKGTSVILYNGAESRDGQRMPAGAFSLPMTVRRSSNPTARLEVETSQGLRWLSASEVVMAKRGEPSGAGGPFPATPGARQISRP